MLSFAANYYATGLNPYYFKATNLAIHLLNGIGIYALTVLVLGYYRTRFKTGLTNTTVLSISLVTAAAWLTHPFSLTSVLYVVQRMNSLAAFFTIWGLLLYAWGRTSLDSSKRGIIVAVTSIILFTALASLSKETGALLPLLALILEVTIFQFQTKDKKTKTVLKCFFILTIAVPTVFIAISILIHPDIILTPYKNRMFTLEERVMTEARVMWFYLQQIILPTVGQMSLSHDDMPLSHSLLNPMSTLFSLLGIISLVGISIAMRKRAPLVSFGLLFFFAGHLLESTIFPLEIIFEHRNYLPMYGLLLCLFYYLLFPIAYIKTLKLRWLVSILLISLFAFNTYTRANIWSNPFDLAMYDVTHRPLSARNNSNMGTAYANINNTNPDAMKYFYTQAQYYFEQATKVNANFTDGLFGSIMLSSKRGELVAKQWTEELKHRLRYAPFANNSGDQLDLLVTCVSNSTCKIDRPILSNLIEAALKNPTLAGANLPIVFTAQGHYLVSIENDYSAAVEAFRKAADSSNEQEYRVSLIRFLVVLQRNSEALKQLTILQKLDKAGIYTNEIEIRRKIIESQEKSVPIYK